MPKSRTLAEIRELFIQLWPEGSLYDWYSPAANVSRFVDAIAEVLKEFLFDLLERARIELHPPTAVEKLSDWETALGLTTTLAAQLGTIAQRQAAVLSKWREHGAFTNSNVRAILGSLLGYVNPGRLVIYETNRVAMRTAHTYRDDLESAIPSSSGGALRRKMFIPDGGTCGSAGAQLILRITHPAIEQLSFALTSPAGKTKTWGRVAVGPAGRREVRLYGPEFKGTQCHVEWTLAVASERFSGTLHDWSLFVEGYGTGGLGGDLFDWGIHADPALVGGNGVAPDMSAALQALARIKHAHTLGHVIRSIEAIPNDPLSIPDAMIPGW